MYVFKLGSDEGGSTVHTTATAVIGISAPLSTPAATTGTSWRVMTYSLHRYRGEFGKFDHFIFSSDCVHVVRVSSYKIDSMQVYILLLGKEYISNT